MLSPESRNNGSENGKHWVNRRSPRKTLYSFEMKAQNVMPIPNRKEKAGRCLKKNKFSRQVGLELIGYW
jgi:hypothetical protein